MIDTRLAASTMLPAASRSFQRSTLNASSVDKNRTELLHSPLRSTAWAQQCPRDPDPDRAHLIAPRGDIGEKKTPARGFWGVFFLSTTKLNIFNRLMRK